MSTDGYAKSWLDWESASGGRSVLGGTWQNIREQYDELTKALMPMLPKFSENVDVKEGDVEGIKYRIYTPKGATGPMPTAVWFHGGGFMVGDLNSDHLICGVICEQMKHAVVNVDYRLTPENPWPAQLEDAMKMYRWTHANASSFGGDPQKMYTGGGSAGGALALQTANAVVKDASLKDSLKGVIALVPATIHRTTIPDKYKSKYKAYDDNKTGVPIIDRTSMDIFFEHLKADPSDPSCFTLLDSDNHKNFPPVYFASCEFDPLRDDAYVMEEALKEAGVPTKHEHYKGFPHYFWIIPAVPEGQKFVGDMLGGIGWIQSKM